jgi:hypothetical protein
VRFFLQLPDGTRSRSELLKAMKAEFTETPTEELKGRDLFRCI